MKLCVEGGRVPGHEVLRMCHWSDPNSFVGTRVRLPVGRPPPHLLTQDPAVGQYRRPLETPPLPSWFHVWKLRDLRFPL